MKTPAASVAVGGGMNAAMMLQNDWFSTPGELDTEPQNGYIQQVNLVCGSLFSDEFVSSTQCPTTLAACSCLSNY